jgi:hypothetical protein
MPEQQDATFRTFEDLDVYKKAREFRKRMYAAARKLPDLKSTNLVVRSVELLFR